MCQAFEGEYRFFAAIEQGKREQICTDKGSHNMSGNRDWDTCINCWKTNKKIKQEEKELVKRELAELHRLQLKYNARVDDDTCWIN